jgi:hypothetical protein
VVAAAAGDPLLVGARHGERRPVWRLIHLECAGDPPVVDLASALLGYVEAAGPVVDDHVACDGARAAVSVGSAASSGACRPGSE